jgi:hypothetical protein
MSVLPFMPLIALRNRPAIELCKTKWLLPGFMSLQTFPTLGGIFIGSNALRLVIWDTGTGLVYRVWKDARATAPNCNRSTSPLGDVSTRSPYS